MSDDFGPARAALDGGDFGELARLLAGHLEEGDPLLEWAREHVVRTPRGRTFLVELLRHHAASSPSEAELSRLLEELSAHSVELEELAARDEADLAALMTQLEGQAVVLEELGELANPFDEGGELEAARALSAGNPHALTLCEMASTLAACAVDVAQAADDDERGAALVRALATIEHIRAELVGD